MDQPNPMSLSPKPSSASTLVSISTRFESQ
ncbi:hypothetical protein AAZX31_15G178200 [Glycine max]